MSDDPCACESVCSLPPDELQARIATVRAELVPLIRRRERLADGIAWEFAGGEAMRARLEQFVAFERECCSGLEFAIEEQGADALRVTVRGPGAGEFEALGTPGAGDGRLGRAATAGGIGVVASLVLCCGLPLAVASVAGVAVAAPLARFDNPLAIGVGALVIAVPTWRLLDRRYRRSCGDRGC